MVKAYWIAVALAVGIVLGLFIGRPGAPAPQPPDAATPHEVAASPTPPSPRQPEAPPVSARAPSPAPRPHDPGIAAKVAGDAPTAPGAPGKSADALVATDVNGVPLGPAENLQTLHEKFLREERDDSWAPLREAEFENSVVAELSSGKFRKDRIECRATMCELEFSARGEQVEQLSKWWEAINHQPPNPQSGQLQMRMGALNAENGGASVKLLFVKPEQLPPPEKN